MGVVPVRMSASEVHSAAKDAEGGCAAIIYGSMHSTSTPTTMVSSNPKVASHMVGLDGAQSSEACRPNVLSHLKHLTHTIDSRDT